MIPFLAFDASLIGRPAPALVGSTWLNSAAAPNLKGRVSIVHFWTFGCSNCKANLPRYNRWYSAYASRGVAFVGVHTPETRTESVVANVEAALPKEQIKYPVLIDGEGRNWRAWSQRYWPTVYILDRRGVVRYAWEGELEYQNQGGDAACRRVIEQLLTEK